jgi:hypothetical protein
LITSQQLIFFQIAQMLLIKKIDCHVYTGSTVNIIIISNYLLQPSVSY